MSEEEKKRRRLQKMVGVCRLFVILCLCRRLATEGVMYLVCLSVCPASIRPCIIKFVSTITYELRAEFHQIYTLVAHGDKDELITFSDWKVSGKCHEEIFWQKHISRPFAVEDRFCSSSVSRFCFIVGLSCILW